MGTSVDELKEEISHLKNRIDTVAEESANKPWYQSVSTLISVAAFLFSFGTTIVSYHRTNEQDVHNLKSELRALLQRLAALPKENIEVTQKYISDPSTIGILSGYINQENLLLSKQADEVIKQLPKEQVSSTDYTAVALAQENSRNFNAAIIDFNNGLKVATILDDEVAALRMLGSLEMMLGKTGDARLHLQQALDIFGKYRDYDDFTKHYTTYLTELNWAGVEAGNGNWDVAQQHVSKAEQILDSMPKGPQTDIYKGQLEQFKRNIAGQPAFPNSPVIPGVPPVLPGNVAPGPAIPSR
jgi:hypothetical protein